MENIANMKQMAKNLARALNLNNKKYDDEQISNYNSVLNQQNIEDEMDNIENLSEKEIAIRNVVFGLRGISNFTKNKSISDQHLYNFLNAFSSNYTVDDNDLPVGLTNETKLIFIVRFIEALLNLLKEDLQSNQNELVASLIQFGLDVIVEIANSL